jgi:hypothetical protein
MRQPPLLKTHPCPSARAQMVQGKPPGDAGRATKQFSKGLRQAAELQAAALQGELEDTSSDDEDFDVDGRVSDDDDDDGDDDDEDEDEEEEEAGAAQQAAGKRKARPGQGKRKGVAAFVDDAAAEDDDEEEEAGVRYTGVLGRACALR